MKVKLQVNKPIPHIINVEAEPTSVDQMDFALCKKCGKTYWFYSIFCCGLAITPIKIV